MTLVIALDGGTSLLRLKDVTKLHVNVCDTVHLLAGILQCNGGKLEEAEALVRELLSNNSLFVRQLYEDKPLALRARD